MNPAHVALVTFGAISFVAWRLAQRRVVVLERLVDAHQSSLMLAWEDNAKLLAASVRLLAATTRLNDAISEQTQTIIVPPSGGMVA